MKKLLNTLYVTTPDAYLSLDGENVVVRLKDNEIGRVPIHNLENIVTFGLQGASPALMRHICESGKGLSFFSSGGRFLCRVEGEERGNVLLRREQYRIADDERRSLPVAVNMIGAQMPALFSTVFCAIIRFPPMVKRYVPPQTICGIRYPRYAAPQTLTHCAGWKV